MASVSTTRTGRWPRVRAWWRSPEDQPRWARPALLALTVLAGFLYAWNATGNLEIYYAAAVRSMSMSWHDFVFASFDPAGTISLDKLPGAFWVQALSVRVFGVHAWAIVAPQVVEGMASVLVLYRVVRRLSGPLAGIVAATVLVASPATVLLNRGNIPDTLMVLLLLLAADATVSAIVSGRLRSLIVAGILVGLAFQAKMIEAWLVLPAFALAYLVGAHGALGRKLGRLLAAGAVVAAMSLSWMVLVSAWPAHDRPYVDGSSTNSIFSQVFVYNGFGRVDQPSPNQLLTKAIGLTLGSTPPGWDRLLSGTDGRDVAWLIPAALVALVACVLASRRRDDLLRAGTAMWGTWLVVLLVVFSVSTTINPYYTAALSPAIAALLGLGLSLAWEHRTSPVALRAVAASVAVTCGYAIWLLPSDGVGVISGLPEIVGVLGLAAVAVLLLPARALTRGGAAIRAGATTRAGAVTLAAIAIVAAPAAASVSVVAKRFGPFDTPFEGAGASALARTLGGVADQTRALLPGLEAAARNQPILMATQTSAVAAPFIYDSGREVLPIGGYTGTIPEPSGANLRAMIRAGDFHIVIQSPTVTDPRLVQVARQCFPVPGASQSPGRLRFAVYYCGRPPGL
jgi:4-amino-4-deoxy-L-arabinose transferase-like glycosyltransferase